MSMVHTGVKYDVQYEFGWAPVELPAKVLEWRERSRAQKEAGHPSAPAGGPPPGTEEVGQPSAPREQKIWEEHDITVEDVEMTIAAEEEKTRKEWLNIVGKHEGPKVSNEHKDTPAGLAHEDMILRAAYERHEREMLELDHIHHGI